MSAARTTLPPHGTQRDGRFNSDRSAWTVAGLYAFAGMMCAILLGGLSVWFLGSVAIAGLSATAFTFNFHIPAALVRLFALGRTAAKYGERLLGHKAALRDQTTRRTELFIAMAAVPTVRSTSWQLGDTARLADYLDDVEDVDYAPLRVTLPVLTMVTAILLCLAATLVIAPLALLPIGALLLVIVTNARTLAHSGAATWCEVRASRRNGAQTFGAALAAVVPLQAEGRWQQLLDEAFVPFAQSDKQVLTLRQAQSTLDALGGVLGAVAALSVIGAAWLVGARFEALLVPVFLAFTWFALGETLHGVSKMLIAHVRRDAAAAELMRWTQPSAPTTSVTGNLAEHRYGTLSLSGLQRRAPEGRPIGKQFTASLQAGKPTILVGESGCGKTSLLKQIAGWTGDDVIISDTIALLPNARRYLTHLCLHDAAVLDDTVRANLFSPGCSDDDLWRALEAVELHDRVELAGGLDGWIRQETLSLGEAQRLNLARAWLTRKPIVLLDEPTEHLDQDQGKRILTRLLHRLKDQVVVLSSHCHSAIPGAATTRL